jgi:DNA (cytosine-5)-methyltransferase 1
LNLPEEMNINRTNFSHKISAVDLFCGAGGLTRGLADAGIPVLAGYDIDSSCKFAYEHNNLGSHFIAQSVADLSIKDLNHVFGSSKTRILAGCAPCQPFSKYTQGLDTREDAKWGLLHEFGRLVVGVKPEIVSMENVPELQRHEILQDFLKILDDAKYHISYQEAYCPDFGIPQQRRRLVLLASRFGPISLQKPSITGHPQTVREAISHLPPLQAGESSTDRFHRASRLSDLNTKRIKASKPGGCWRDWPEDLVAKCHQTEMGKNYPSVYGRMKWESPSPTITTQFFGYGNGRFGHPEQDRALSLREGALLQTFPHDYEFVPKDQPISFAQAGKMIGNAVPVRLGEAIGVSILKHLEIHQSPSSI